MRKPGTPLTGKSSRINGRLPQLPVPPYLPMLSCHSGAFLEKSFCRRVAKSSCCKHGNKLSSLLPAFWKRHSRTT